MQRKKTILFIGSACFSVFSLQAQQSVHGSGGNASGSGGTVSYAVGQVAYTANTGTTGSIAAGVQQPFEIQVFLGVDNFNINLQLAVYPNPTANWLQLEVKNYNFENLQYQLLDFTGKQLASSKINAETTSIALEQYPPAIYLLKVLDNNKEVKTYKIIKK